LAFSAAIVTEMVTPMMLAAIEIRTRDGHVAGLERSRVTAPIAISGHKHSAICTHIKQIISTATANPTRIDMVNSNAKCV
jgi:hypothetical protein